MANFTDAQKAQIRQYLGFSELFHDIDARLEGMMNQLGSRAPEAVSRVIANLQRIADIDARLDCALDNLNITKAEDVEFSGEPQLDALRNQGRMLIQQIAIVFELIPKRDYFAVYDGCGGVVPLG